MTAVFGWTVAAATVGIANGEYLSLSAGIQISLTWTKQVTSSNRSTSHTLSLPLP